MKTAWVDLDDTLWDFKGNSRIALAALYDQYCLEQSFGGVERWIEAYEKVNHELWDKYSRALIDKLTLMSTRFRLPLEQAGHPRAVELGARFDGEYLDLLAQCTGLVPGAIELLVRLRMAGYRTGILSNGFVEVQHRKIKNSGLAPYIDVVVLSDEIEINKPDVRLYEYAATKAGSTCPCDNLMIGDNPDTDIKGAVAAGWQAIFYNPECRELSLPGVTSVVSLDDIVEE